jgi:putative ABC transport system permease protein
MAGGLALLFAWASLQVAVTLLAGALPPEYGTLVFRVTPDLAIFSYALVISLFAAVLFGLAPALEGVGSGLSSSERTSTSAAGSRRLQNILVAAQVSLSLVLLIAGSLLVRSAIHAITTDPGYDAKRVVDLELQFPESSTYTAGRKTTTVGDLRARLGALPGVTAVTSARPPGAANFVTGAVPVDASTADSASGAPGGHRAPLPLLYGYVEANYFQTLGITLSRGRVFESGPGESERSVILSESAARSLWPDQDPVGRTVRLGATDEKVRLGSDFPADGSAYQVIGVARDTRGVQFDGSGSRQVYLASSSDRFQKYGILIRTDSDPAGILEAIDPLIASIDPDLAATSTTLQETLRRSGPFVVSSISAAVASTIGLLGLLLASMGIYGTVSYIVVLRTHELGIRMAVGAQPRDILGLILFESTRPVLVGLAVGMLLAVGASYLLRGLLYGLNTVDVVSFAGVSLLFLTIALLAAYPPSRRAMRVDPVVALRYE